jgi:adenylate kinase family enzyme
MFEPLILFCYTSDMNKEINTLLITGPTGSGKSTLGQHIAGRNGWVYLSEDDYWAKNGWRDELRGEEQEREIQQQVFGDLLSATKAGKSVVLEFILYKQSPNPLTAYQERLTEHAIKFGTIALRPSLDTILERVKERGRPNDIDDLERVRREAESQVSILDSEFINPIWIIDPTSATVDALANECLTRLLNQE